jgi:thiamine biosynthesis lipoprotein
VARLSGETMGTTYHVTAIGDDLDPAALGVAIEQALAAVNASMSSWDPNSEVSRFSAMDHAGPMPISDAFATVMTAAMQVHEQSEGRFDVTLGPLIDLWGFGPRAPEDEPPPDDAIAKALAEVGQSRLLSLDGPAKTLAKANAGVGVNLSAIAKGYGADAVAASLRAAGVERYMVEIGGDLVTRGVNAEGAPWRIGVESPTPGAGVVQLVVPVSDRGMATSGDYRNYFEADGVRYSHILDPTTGRPITHRTSSVTVVAENAMLADAWATAMLALGEVDGLRIAEARDLAVFFISRGASGAEDAYITAQSGAFADLLSKE